MIICKNNDFEFHLLTLVIEFDSETTVLYESFNVVQFIDTYFFPDEQHTSVKDFEYYSKLFLYEGCFQTVDKKAYITMAGFKHFFSCFVGLRIAAKKHSMERIHSKFINWVLTFDFNTYILRANKFPPGKCKLCQTVMGDSDFDNSSFCKSNQEVISNWRTLCDTFDDSFEYNNDRIDFLVNLAKIAGHENDNTISCKKCKTDQINYE